MHKCQRDSLTDVPQCDSFYRITCHNDKPLHSLNNKLYILFNLILEETTLEKSSKTPSKKSKTKLKITKSVTTSKPKKRKVLSVKKNGEKVATSKCVIILSQSVTPATQSCYIITNAPSSKPVQAVTQSTTGKHTHLIFCSINF